MKRDVPDIHRGENRPQTREISRLQRGIDRLFDDFLSPFPELLGGGREQWVNFVPAVDIEETDKEYLVKMDLPGVSKDNVKIELQDNQLIVSGEKKEEKEKKEKGNVISMERFQGSFMRSFALPPSVDAERVQANYRDGVLEITIPKSEAAKPKQIQIQVKEAQPPKGERAA